MILIRTRKPIADQERHSVIAAAIARFPVVV
jgi:hypothetical protein